MNYALMWMVASFASNYKDYVYSVWTNTPYEGGWKEVDKSAIFEVINEVEIEKDFSLQSMVIQWLVTNKSPILQAMEKLFVENGYEYEWPYDAFIYEASSSEYLAFLDHYVRVKLTKKK